MTTASLLGTRIRDARLAKGWTQTQLAEQLGTTKKSVGMWERTGNISALSLGRLTQVLEGLNVQGHLVEEEAPSNGFRHFTMTVPVGPESPLDTLRRVRRELTRMSVELDSALEALEKSQQ